MATSLNALTLRINADTSSLSAGVKLARRDINTVNSALRRAAGDSGKAQAATQSLANVMASGAITQAEYARAQKAINDQLAASTGVTRRVNAMVAASTPPTQRLASQIRELTSEYRRGNITQEQFARTNRRLRADMQQTGSATTSLAGRLRGLVAAYVGLQAVKGAFSFALELEQSALSFEVLTGSATKGKEVLNDLKDLAASTPLSFPGVAKAEQTLLSFGVNVDKSIPLLRQLGDVAGGNAERFQSLALVMGQVRANGKLDGQDRLQFINAGWNPLNEMVKTTGKSMGQLREEMSKGNISFQMVEDALTSATSAGGLFHGMLAKFGESTGGSLTLLVSDIQAFSAEMIAKTFPAVEAVSESLRGLVAGVKDFVDNMTPARAGTTMFIGGLSAFLLIGPQVIAAVRSIVLAIRSWIVAQTALFALSGPKGWIMLAGGLVATGAAAWGVSAAFDAQDAKMASATETSKANTAAVAANELAQNQLAATIASRQLQRDDALASYEKEWRAIRNSNVALREGTGYAAEMLRLRKEQDMLDKGYTQKQVDHLAELTKQNDALKTANKEEAARNKLIADRNKAIESNIMRIGNSVKQSLVTPYDTLVQRLAEINIASQRSFIGAEQAALARQNATSEFTSKTAPIKLELPPSIARGSREEYKLLVDRMNGNKDREEAHKRQQLALQKAQIDTAERTNEILEGQETVRGVS